MLQAETLWTLALDAIEVDDARRALHEARRIRREIEWRRANGAPVG
jgi:hypothetical protein